MAGGGGDHAAAVDREMTSFFGALGAAGRLTLFVAFSLAAALPVRAQQATPDVPGEYLYCPSTGGGCYQSYPAAEAALRAALPDIGHLLRSRSTAPGGGPFNQYYVPDQPPESYGTPWYGARNYSFSYTNCPTSQLPADTYNEYGEILCYSEREVIDSVIAGLSHDSCDGTGHCVAQDFSVVGDYINPRVYGTRFTYPEARKIKYTKVYTSGQRTEAFYLLFKEQPFTCPKGFSVVESQQVLNYPNVCRNYTTVSINKNKAQQKGPCSECNASSGDEARAESDFVFGGIPFVRNYHSLREVQYGESKIGVGWTHSFSSRANTGYTTIYTRNGTALDLRSMGSGVFSAKGSSGAIAVMQADESLWVTEDSGLVSGSYKGLLRWIYNPDDPSQRVDLQYDWGSNGQYLARAVDVAGRIATFRYGSGNVLAGVDLPDGRQINYGYDADGNLTSVDYGNGQVKRYHYGEADLAPSGERNLLTGVTAEDGARFADFQYDVYGRVKASSLRGAAGPVEATHVRYTATDSAEVDSARSGTTSYSYQSGSDRMPLTTTDASGTVTKTYDALAHLSTVTDKRGVTAQLSYDGFGRLSERIDAANDASGNKRTIQTDWDSSLSVKRLKERRTLNAAGAIILKETWSYNSLGQILVATRTDPQLGITRSTSYTYCEQNGVDGATCPRVGHLLTIDGPRTDVNDVTTYTYRMADAVGCDTSPATCAYRKGDLWKVTNAKNQVSEVLASDGAGRVLSSKDANGVVTDLEYTPRGWLAASKVRGTNGAVETDDVITRIDYYPTGLVQKVTQPDGAYTSFEYDAAHRLTAISNNSGERIEYTLDNAGNRIKEDTKDVSGNLRRTLSRVYNQLGQLQAAKDAYGYATTMTYDPSGNSDTVTDAQGRVSDSDYDPLDRLSRTLQDTAGVKAETRFGYDALDNLRTVVDPKGLTTAYTYNGLGDLTQLASPDTGTTTYTYDEAGNLKTKQDARGAAYVEAYSYDALNRLTDVTYPGSSSTTFFKNYVYDTLNSVCPTGEQSPIGHVTKMTDYSGNTQYCYDRFGRLTRKVQTTYGKVMTLVYQYAVSGRLTSITYPSGLKATYSYNVLGKPYKVSVTRPGQAAQWVIIGAAHYPFGPVSKLTYPDRSVLRSHDRNYRPLLVEDSTGGGLANLYDWDEVGNLRTLSDSGVGAAISMPLRRYDYDGLNRLTASNDADGNPLQGYSYDATGNRLSTTNVNGAGTASYSYPVANHRLTWVGAEARTYDALGNTRSIGGTARQFTYAVDGRMWTASRNGVIQSYYRYNGRGEQVWAYASSTDPNQRRFIYDEAGHWIGEYDVNMGRVNEFIWFGDLPVGIVQGTDAANQPLYYVEADHLGTPRGVIDSSNGKTVWSWPLQDEAFGTSTPMQDPDGDGAQFVLDMRFPGQRYDSASGLNYNYFRDYDPATGRYVESDPIGLRGGPGTFVYVNANSFNATDRRGLVKWSGEMTATSVAAGIGGSLYTFRLVSECAGGKQATATVVAVGPTVGLDLELGLPPVSGSFGSVDFDDKMLVTDPRNLEGHFQIASIGIAAATGYGCSAIMIGGAKSASCDWEYGLEAGLGITFGTSTVIKSEVWDCGCEQKK